ncbi:hypothetical protein NUH87_05830 [Pseudomonas batumici]|uniref:hypothetical protein n=1 Tax=Pseudomonas batumici TaxID=226910 RepID=UPI0030CDFE7E
MDVQELEESSVLSITVDQAHRYFEMVVSLDDGTKYKLMAWNADGSELTIRLGALHVQNSGVLGELEGINIVEHVLFLEGDFGDIAIKATTILVEKLVQEAALDQFQPFATGCNRPDADNTGMP